MPNRHKRIDCGATRKANIVSRPDVIRNIRAWNVECQIMTMWWRASPGAGQLFVTASATICEIVTHQNRARWRGYRLFLVSRDLPPSNQPKRKLKYLFMVAVQQDSLRLWPTETFQTLSVLLNDQHAGRRQWGYASSHSTGYFLLLKNNNHWYVSLY